jgi:hypothetical protein
LHADIQFEEKKVKKSIKDAAKRGDMKTAKVRGRLSPMAISCALTLPQHRLLPWAKCSDASPVSKVLVR